MSLGLSLKAKTSLEKELENILNEKLRWFEVKANVWSDEITIKIIWSKLYYDNCREKDIDECVKKAFARFHLPKLLVKLEEATIKAKTYYEAHSDFVSIVTEISILPRHHISEIKPENVAGLVQKTLAALFAFK